MGVSIINLLVPTSLESMIPMLVVSIELTSFTQWGFQYLQTAQSIWLRILSIALQEKLKVLDFV